MTFIEPAYEAVAVSGQAELVNQYIILACATVVIFDHILTFAEEVRVIWGARRTLASVIFLVNRYISLGGYITVMYYQCVWNGPESVYRDVILCSKGPCAGLSRFVAILALTNQFAIAVTMVLRIYALYQRNFFVLASICVFGFLSTAVLAYIIFSMVGIAPGVSLPSSPQDPTGYLLPAKNCITRIGKMRTDLDIRDSVTHLVSYVLAITSTILFDIIVFTLTAYRTWNTWYTGMRSLPPLYMLLFRDGCIYFIFMITANVLPLICFWILPGEIFTTQMGSNSIFGPAISVVLLSRLILNLRLENEYIVNGDYLKTDRTQRMLFAPRLLGNLTAELRDIGDVDNEDGGE